MRLPGYCRLLAGFLLASLSVFGQAQGQDQVRQQHVGRVLDWSYYHVILSGGLPAADLKRAQAEPRIFVLRSDDITSRTITGTLSGVNYPGGLAASSSIT
jgi:hypothetical protein